MSLLCFPKHEYAHMQQAHIHGKFAQGRVLKILAMVRPPSDQEMHSSHEFAVSLQTWLIGNTVSDLLIAGAMLYHVNPFRFTEIASLYADHLTPIPQLIQRRARDGRLSTHALVSIVRLTIETNIMTSKSPESRYINPRLIFSQLLLVLYHC